MTSHKTTRALVLSILLVALVAVAAQANTSHEGWPPITGDLKMHKADQSGDLRATKVDKHNELLGGHGDDTISAGNVGDVLWGDYKPSGQPESQVDTLVGGPGRDFIYASHGTNNVSAGAGSDIIHAHFGRGTIDCGSGRDTLFISHRSKPRYKIANCDRVSFKTLGY